MISKSLLLAALVAAGLALPSKADAATARVTVDLHLRTGPGTGYRSILVIPAGALVDVYRCYSWCEVNYRGYIGWASARYISGAAYPSYPRYPSWPPVYYRPPPPTFGFIQPPWWDDHYHAWYDGRRWYYDGRWYDRPTFSLYFRFGN